MAMEIDFIGVPMNLGSRHLGVEMGTAALRELVFGRERCRKWNDLGDIPCRTVAHGFGGDDALLPYIHDISLSCVNLRDAVAQSLRNGHFPFVAGGDHAVAWGSLSGVMKAVGRPECLYVDAHGDFNSAAESPSHNVHGMHMCYLMGFERHPMADAIQEGASINSDNVYFVGARSLDAYEKRMTGARNIGIYKSFPMHLQGRDNLHISFDIDVLDPSVAPGTGVPESGGMMPDEVMDVLEKAFKLNKVCSFDFVEVNPLLDISNRTLDVAGEIIDYLDRELLP